MLYILLKDSRRSDRFSPYGVLQTVNKVKNKCNIMFIEDSGDYAVFFLNLKFLGGVNIIKELQINEQIREKEVRVIDSDGSQLGVMSTKDALRIAEGKKLDLVNVSPTLKFGTIIPEMPELTGIKGILYMWYQGAI